MLNDQLIMSSIPRIRQHSEKQADLNKLVETFVDANAQILTQIYNNNSQIIYGRRGTGKTHIFKVLSSKLLSDKKNIVVYIDARNLGSTSQFSDTTVPLKQRCLSLFKDVLGDLNNHLLEYIVLQPSEKANAALEVLDEMSDVMTEPVSYYSLESVTRRKKDKSTKKSSVGLSLKSKKGLDLDLKDSIGKDLEEEETTSYTVDQEDKVIFPALHSALNKMLKILDANLILLLDEWSSFPVDIQPYLSEFLKRSFLSSSRIVIKIAALEFRSNFSEIRNSKQVLGFELGGDISALLDIDDYYVYDRNTKLVPKIFSEILFKHIKSELPENYLEEKYDIASSSKLVSVLFAERAAFNELVRAAEGVIRDLICIFSSSYFGAQKRNKAKITKNDVLEAANQWFLKDKSYNLSDYLWRVLENIIKEIVERRKIRYFMLPRKLEKHEIIQQLYDLRVLHLVERGTIDKKSPSKRYNTYTLDYGTYSGLYKIDKKRAQAYKNIRTDKIEILPEKLLSI